MSLSKRFLSILLCLIVVFQAFFLCQTQAVALSEAQIEANQRTIFDFLTKEMGYNTAAASGVLANIEKESRFNPNVGGDGGTSYGLCQWHNSRWDDLKSYCKSNGYDWESLTGQLHFLKYELTKSGSYYKNTVHGKLLSVKNTSAGAYDAAYAWCYYFEVPNNREEQAKARGNTAKNTYWPEFNAYATLKVTLADFSVLPGATYKIKPKITNTAEIKSITYKSSDETVMKVDSNGNITTGYAGRAEITCTVTDKYGNKVSDTCKAEVEFTSWKRLPAILLEICRIILNIMGI